MKTNVIKYLEILEKHKNLLGLSDYKILVNSKIENHSNIADANVDIYEKFIKVNLYKQFIELNSLEQKDVLIHELVHARLNIANQECDQASKFIEENFVNDVTRGLMKLETNKHRRHIHRKPRRKSR